MNWINILKKIQYNTQMKLIIVLLLVLAFGIVNSRILNISEDNRYYDIEKYDDYLEVVGKSIECEGVTITLESAAADKNILILSFLVSNTEEIKDLNDADIHISSLKINGKEMCLSSKNNLELINSNQARIVKGIVWDYNNMPNSINLSVGIEKMFNKEGNWDIKFSVDTYKILQNTYSEKINSRINMKDLKWTIKEATISPLTVKIESSYTAFSKRRLGFLVLDENYNELIKLDEDIFKDFGHYAYVEKYINSEPFEKLKVIPIYYGENKAEESSITNKINLDEFHQFYLSVNRNLLIKVEDCIVDEKYTIIKYNYEYMGNTILKDLNKLYLKCDGVIYNEKEGEEIENIKKDYYKNGYRAAIFERIDSKNFEIGCYDESSALLLEDYAFEIEN